MTEQLLYHLVTCVPILAPFLSSYEALEKTFSCLGFYNVAFPHKTSVRMKWKTYKKKWTQCIAQSRCMMNVNFPRLPFHKCPCDRKNDSYERYIDHCLMASSLVQLVRTVITRAGSWVKNPVWARQTLLPSFLLLSPPPHSSSFKMVSTLWVWGNRKICAQELWMPISNARKK